MKGQLDLNQLVFMSNLPFFVLEDRERFNAKLDWNLLETEIFWNPLSVFGVRVIEKLEQVFAWSEHDV